MWAQEPGAGPGDERETCAMEDSSLGHGMLRIRLLTGTGATDHYQLDSDSGLQLPVSAC